MKITEKIKDKLIFYSLIIFLLFGIYYFINIFAYFDVQNLCYINLQEDILSGDKKTMHQAIKLLKKNNKEDYKNLCRFVDTISEKYCFAFDPRVESKNEDPWQPGCFVKGSKIIYIKPIEETSNLIIQKRSEEIKKFMLMSKNYWEDKK